MGKRVLVFGGGSDIGSAIVNKFAAEGHEAFWTYHSTKRDQPGKAISCDLTAPDQLEIDGVFRKAEGELDLVVTAAFPFIQSSSLDFKRYLEAESFLRGHVYIMIKSAERLVRDGRIINMLGQSVERGLPGGAFYAASFAFLHNFGNSLNAKEGKEGRLSVCDLLLGPVETREWMGLSPEVIGRYRSRVAKFITVGQVADTVMFLSQAPVMPSTFKLDAFYGY